MYIYAYTLKYIYIYCATIATCTCLVHIVYMHSVDILYYTYTAYLFVAA